MTQPRIASTDPLRERLAAALAPAYTVEGEIGRGGMSVVYRARDVRLRRDVAIKILPPELAFVTNVRERFLREAQTAAQLAHPNIVPIYGVEEKDALVWIVMALIEGETLGDRLTREGRLAAPEAQRILCSVADALVYAHAHGVVHRDIKPDNILLERDSLRVLVTDFGIARAAEGDARLTLTGVAVGTPTYMSPEQAIGESEIDGRSDLYSLGIVGYQMLAGAPPFTANSTPALLLKQVSEPLPPLKVRAASAPSALVEAIERALAKKPHDRFSSVATFSDAVKHGRASAHLPPPAIGVPAVPAPPHAPASHAPSNAAAVSSRETPPRFRAAEVRGAAPMPPPSVPVPPRPPMPLAGAHDVPAWVYSANASGMSLDLHAQSFRRRFFRTMGTLSFLGIINGLTSPHFAWVVFPAVGMLIGLSARWRPLGDAGLSFMDVVQNRNAVRSAGIEGSVPAQLFSDSLAGRARRFARRFKLAGAAAGVSAFGVAMAALSGGQPVFAAPVFGGAAVAFVSLISAMRAARPLRALGFRRRDMLRGTWRDSDASRSPNVAFRLREEEVSQLASPDVVMSRYGERLRSAVDDRTAIRQQMLRFGDTLPSQLRDVLPTANALVDLVASLAGSLHRLDRDMGATGDGSLEERIADLRSRGARDSDGSLRLLLDQREKLSQLEAGRSTLRAKLDTVAVQLQNMRLDVVRLGSMGLEAPAAVQIGEATQQARALSKDLAYLLEGAREVERG
jgi:serine/threonine protein kinase